MPETATMDELDGFPPEWRDRWRVAHGRIDHAGYGDLVAGAYRRAGPALAAGIGPAFAIRLASSVSQVAIRSGRLAASLVPQSALLASRRFQGTTAMEAWASAVEDVARRAPEAVLPLLENTGRLVEALDASDFIAFLRMGLHLADGDAGRRRSFFALESAEAIRLVEGRAAGGGLAELRHGLGLYLRALWGIAPPIADHSAIDRVRCGPDQSAVMRASVVGYAMPAAMPPTMRAMMSTVTVGANAARRAAGSDRTTPMTSIILRP